VQGVSANVLAFRSHRCCYCRGTRTRRRRQHGAARSSSGRRHRLRPGSVSARLADLQKRAATIQQWLDNTSDATDGCASDYATTSNNDVRMPREDIVGHLSVLQDQIDVVQGRMAVPAPCRPARPS
jgi:hypothetical protein